MAARDFIQNGPVSVNNIQWRYCNMDTQKGSDASDFTVGWTFHID